MAALRHLTTLGSTAVALRPAYAGPHERPLGAGGPPPAWGDKPLGFFTPERRYAVRGGPLTAAQQFKIMVTTLHAAGIEVLLDVLYTPTAEGNHLGPTLSLRGIDNAAYYQLAPDNLRYYRAAPAPATPSTCGTRTCSSSSWTACATGLPKCTWTASASPGPVH